MQSSSIKEKDCIMCVKVICSKCGKQLEDGFLYCTECGNLVGQAQNSIASNQTSTSNKIKNEINSFVERFGDKKISCQLSIAAIVSMISIKILGFIIVAILITIINAFLIYSNFRRTSKIDLKMLVLSSAVLLAGILILI